MKKLTAPVPVYFLLIGFLLAGFTFPLGTANADELTKAERSKIFDVIRIVLTDEQPEADRGGNQKRKGNKKSKGKGKKGLPQGLAKRNSLPPGLQKKYDETGELPPGLQKKLEGRLNASLSGKSATVQGNKVIVKDNTTGKVIDIIENVVDLIAQGSAN